MALTLCAALSWGCTDANPSYQGGDNGVGRDGSVDRPITRDDAGDGPVGDSTVDQLQPDVVPAVCGTDKDCDDGRDCTDDRCDKAAQKCINTLKSNRCLIGGKCYEKDDSPSDNSCSVCSPGDDPLAWTARSDGDACGDDGLACTTDTCAQGKCEHEVKAGNCLINGACLADGDSDPNDACKECAASQSTTQTTFVDGKACTPVGGVAAFCARAACRDVVEDNTLVVGGASVRSSQLNAVAKVTGSGVWAVGEYTSDTDGTRGVIARLDGTALSTPTTTPDALNAISHRLAVGDNGGAYRFSGTNWTRSLSLEGQLGGKDRYGLWGATATATTSVYLVSGTNVNVNTEPAIWECTDSLGLFNCTSYEGTISKGARIGAVFGTLAGGSFGPSWAAAFGTYEDIYYRPSSGKWSWNGPQGCFDGSNTACDNTDSHDFADMFGSSDSDIWAVGTNGLVVAYDGSGWTRDNNVVTAQNTYDFDAVFSHPADNLVTIAAHRDAGGNRTVVFFNYNRALKRWFGPITVRTFTGTVRSGYIADMGGEGYSNMWLVGRRPQSLGGVNASYRAWVLHLK